MPAKRIHLIRHGEVHNPGAVIYGRLPHFHLSDRGHKMAAAAAEELKNQKRPVNRVFASPLLRTRESAEHVESAFGLDATTDERLIEPWNNFEGRKLGGLHIIARPHLYYQLRNPSRPSWGEPFEDIASRMLEAMDHAWNSVPDGDVVLVSHQLPIEMVHRKLSGKKLPHNPRKRRTALSSVTSFERQGNQWVEVDYKDLGRAPERCYLIKQLIAAVAIAGLLTGCTANDPLADQYKAGDNKNYIAGDGTVTEFATDSRGSAVKWSGTTESGEVISSDALSGVVTVMNFWYAGCAPCRAEAPDLVALQKEFSNAQFVGVNVRDSGNLIAFEKNFDITWPSVIDASTGSVLLAFTGIVTPQAVPTTIVIGKDGKVTARVLGRIDKSILGTLIKSAIAE